MEEHHAIQYYIQWSLVHLPEAKLSKLLLTWWMLTGSLSTCLISTYNKIFTWHTCKDLSLPNSLVNNEMWIAICLWHYHHSTFVKIENDSGLMTLWHNSWQRACVFDAQHWVLAMLFVLPIKGEIVCQTLFINFVSTILWPWARGIFILLLRCMFNIPNRCEILNLFVQ